MALGLRFSLSHRHTAQTARYLVQSVEIST